MEGDTTVQGENFKADDDVPIAWHGRNPRLYEELDHSYCATAWVDCTCTDGVLAMHCIRKKKTYFGLTHSPLHMQMVRERLESEVFNAFQTEDDEDLAQADLIQFPTKLRGKPKGKVTPKHTNKEDAEGKGHKGNKEDKGNKADKEGTRPKPDPKPAKKDQAKGGRPGSRRGRSRVRRAERTPQRRRLRRLPSSNSSRTWATAPRGATTTQRAPATSRTRRRRSRARPLDPPFDIGCWFFRQFMLSENGKSTMRRSAHSL